MRRRIAICLMLFAITVATTASAQSGVRRGALIGGAIGAGVTGALGAFITHAGCDAADCSDAWIDGGVPGTVIGGLAGAGLGAAIGALLDGGKERGAGSPRRGYAVMVDGSAARAEWNSIDHSVYGVRGMAGLQRGGLLVGPSIEWLGNGDWRLFGLGVAARLDPGTGTVRPFVELSAGRYDWRNPARPFQCVPGAPGCDVDYGTLTDAYLGGAGAVGVAVGDPGGRWRVFASVRYHVAPGRPIGEPVSTTTRALRQLSLGAMIPIR